jgi:DNA-binding NarL/FixJ family response regulator
MPIVFIGISKYGAVYRPSEYPAGLGVPCRTFVLHLRSSALANPPAMTRRPPPLTCCDGCHTLTEREVQVIRGIATGQTSREIGEDLGISLRTVNTYREHLKKKLGISSVAQLTRYVIEHKIDQHA